MEQPVSLFCLKVTPGERTVELDMVEALLSALDALGLRYEVAAETVWLDIKGRSAFGFDVRHTDRVVILARTDRLPADRRLLQYEPPTTDPRHSKRSLLTTRVC